MQPRCVVAILVILDHSHIFRVIIPEVVYKFNIHGTVHRSMTSSNNQQDAT